MSAALRSTLEKLHWEGKGKGRGGGGKGEEGGERNLKPICNFFQYIHVHTCNEG